MNGGATSRWEQDYDHSSSTEHNNNSNISTTMADDGWGSSAASPAGVQATQQGDGRGMSAEDTRRLMETLASQLEPNPLCSDRRTCTTDDTFCIASVGLPRIGREPSNLMGSVGDVGTGRLLKKIQLADYGAILPVLLEGMAIKIAREDGAGRSWSGLGLDVLTTNRARSRCWTGCARKLLWM